jgi:hypothetical protein
MKNTTGRNLHIPNLNKTDTSMIIKKNMYFHIYIIKLHRMHNKHTQLQRKDNLFYIHIIRKDECTTHAREEKHQPPVNYLL